MDPFYLPEEASLPRAALLAGVGVVMTFWGYRLFHGALKIYGGVGGALLGTALCKTLLPDSALWWLPAAAALAGALLGYFVVKKLYKLALLLTGAAAGLAIWFNASVLVEAQPQWVMWVAPIGCALVTGLLALVLERPLVILGTAAGGAAVLLSGSMEGAALGDIAVGDFDRWIPWIFLAVAALGTAAQFTRKRAEA